MNTKDKMTTFEFFSVVFLYMIIILFAFVRVVFKPLGELSYMESKVILYALIILTIVGNILFLHKRNKNGCDLLLTTLFPFGTYSTLMFYHDMNYIKYILAVAVILTIIFVVVFIIRRLCFAKRKITRKYVFKVVCASQRVIAWGMCIVFVSTFTQILYDNGILRLSNNSVVSGKDSGETIEKNIETILLLQQNEWEKLDKAERLLVMQTVSNIEANYLGIPHELYVQTENLSDGTLGTYEDSSYTITIDTEHLMDSDSFEVLRSVLHECFHGYSHRLVDLYQSADEELQELKFLQSAKAYDTEFSNYTDPDRNFEEYYDMQSEEDARSYAEYGINEYYDRINEYLGVETESSIHSDLSDDGRYTVSYSDDGKAYLYDELLEKSIAGPYQMIYVDEIYFSFDEACRYIGFNGKIGFVDRDGTEITPPIFIEASEMENGLAMVKEKIDGGYYYIDSNGTRITEEYQEANVFEHQGSYARVKIDESKWAIINKQNEVVFTADSIEPLPMVTTLGGAVVDGHAVIFNLDFMGKEEITSVKHLEEYSSISEIYCGYFGIVKSKFDDKYGVVNSIGEVAIPAVYSNIEYMFNEYTESFGEKVTFICYNQDGTRDVINVEW